MNKETKSSFICLLEEALNGAEARYEPEEPARYGEKEVGTIQSKRTRSLFSFVRGLSFQLDAAMKQSSSLESYASGNNTFTHLNRQAHAAALIFWESVYDEFPRIKDENVVIGIRQGWKVVVINERKKS